MKKITIIICYFGKLPNYYKIWEYSAINNPTINFLLVTDQKIKSKENINVVNTSLDNLSKNFSNKLGFDVKISNPYKLCDYKSAYGYLFSEYLGDSDFWGFSDIDLIWGNIRKFITDDILEKNDYILKRGHLTLLKNNEKNKTLFMEKGSIYNYKVVFTHQENFAFDEFSGLHKIYKRNNIIPYCKIPIADIDVKYKRYKIVNSVNYDKQVFLYKDNEILRKYIENGIEKTNEFCYLHFQKKSPLIDPKIIEDLDKENEIKFYIGKNGFKAVNDEEKYSINKFNGNKFEKKEKVMYIENKIKHFFKCNNLEKRIWIKQKLIY